MRNKITWAKLNSKVKLLESKLNQVSTNMTWSGLVTPRLNHQRNLDIILDAGFNYNGVPYTPILDNILDVEKLGVKPIPEEQSLFDEFLAYLCDYYGVKVHAYMLKELKRKAEEDSLDVLNCEAYYEIMQLFNAFGHTTYPDIGDDRIKRLKVYRDRKRWFKPDPSSMLWAYNYYMQRFSYPLQISHNVQDSAKEAFSHTGPKNTGDPYYMRDTTMLDGKSIKELVRELSTKCWSQMDKKDPYNFRDASWLASAYATLFGRNQTKGVETTFKNGKFEITEFKAAGRVIYGVDRFSNNIQSLLYYHKMKHKAQFPEYVGLRDDIALREAIKKTYELDRKFKVIRKNMDVGKYDTGISASAMAMQAAFDIDSFTTNVTGEKIVFLGLVIDALKPIYYKDKVKGSIKLLRAYGGHKSGDYKTADWGSDINLRNSTALLLEIDFDYYSKLIQEYNKVGSSFIKVLGDDLSIAFKSEVHAERFRKLMYERYGWEMNAAKDAPGSPFLQHYLNSKGGISYPLARCLRSALYPESTTKVPSYMFAVGLWMLIDLLKESPHLEYFINFIVKHDKYKLGLYDYDKQKWNSFNEFFAYYTAQSRDFNSKHKATQLNTNDPRFQLIYNSKNEIKSDWLKEKFELISKYVKK